MAYCELCEIAARAEQGRLPAVIVKVIRTEIWLSC